MYVILIETAYLCYEFLSECFSQIWTFFGCGLSTGVYGMSFNVGSDYTLLFHPPTSLSAFLKS